MTHLLDANVLVALSVSDHVHHEAAHAWWADHRQDPFATCPITQGALIRLLMRSGTSAKAAGEVLAAVAALPTHQFWSDEVPYTGVSLAGVLGHRQVTDAYLAQLARGHGGRLVTFDSGLASLRPDVCVLLTP